PAAVSIGLAMPRAGSGSSGCASAATVSITGNIPISGPGSTTPGRGSTMAGGISVVSGTDGAGVIGMAGADVTEAVGGEIVVAEGTTVVAGGIAADGMVAGGAIVVEAGGVAAGGVVDGAGLSTASSG